MNDSASIHVTVDRDFEHIVVICKAVQKRLRVKMIEEFYEIQNKNLIKKSDHFKNLVRLLMQFSKFKNFEKATKFEAKIYIKFQ